MKVVILCGGRGTRMQEQVDFLPKPMLTIGGKPVIWHIMKMYSHYGFNEFVLPLGYKGDVIKDYFLNFRTRISDVTVKTAQGTVTPHMQKPEDWTVHMIDTGLATLTVRRVSLIKHLLEQDDMFMLTYGDGVADIDIAALLKFHKEKGKAATIAGYRPSHRFGVVEHANGVVTKFNEKPQMAELINCGFMVFNREALGYFDGQDIMLESLLPDLVKAGQLAIYPHQGFWFSMDTQREYEELNRLWEMNPKWKVWND